MDRPGGVNYSEPHIAVGWNVRRGIDLMPHDLEESMFLRNPL